MNDIDSKLIVNISILIFGIVLATFYISREIYYEINKIPLIRRKPIMFSDLLLSTYKSISPRHARYIQLSSLLFGIIVVIISMF